MVHFQCPTAPRLSKVPPISLSCKSRKPNNHAQQPKATVVFVGAWLTRCHLELSSMGLVHSHCLKLVGCVNPAGKLVEQSCRHFVVHHDLQRSCLLPDFVHPRPRVNRRLFGVPKQPWSSQPQVSPKTAGRVTVSSVSKVNKSTLSTCAVNRHQRVLKLESFLQEIQRAWHVEVS
jgi:hypothetical protein